MESAERIGSAMRARKRAQLEAMTLPEQLERLRKQWAEEDARRAALKAENERVETWIESLGGHQAWIERYCTPGVQRNTGDEKRRLWMRMRGTRDWIRYFMLRGDEFVHCEVEKR